MYTVTSLTTASRTPARRARDVLAGPQYASLEDLAAARGDLQIAAGLVSRRACRTRAGALWHAWRQRRSGADVRTTPGSGLATVWIGDIKAHPADCRHGCATADGELRDADVR